MFYNILAIDDEPDLLRLLERIIREKTNFTIMAVGNSLEVPDIIKDNEFDVIITDLKMPGLDGMDILKIIKSNNRLEQVIIITAFGSMESAMEALSNDVFDYITKPFKKEQIIFTVDKAIKFQKAMKLNNKILKWFETTPLEEAVELFKQEYLKASTKIDN